MKAKILAAAFAATVATGAFAESVVYNFTATLKTTTAVYGAVKPSILTCLDETEKIVYRKQGTVKIMGLFWGDGCEVISSPTSDGMVFWNVSDKVVIPDLDFEWIALNRIGNAAKQAEGAWKFSSECYEFMGGGFGAVKVSKTKDEDGEVEETYLLNSLAGNLGGYKCAPVFFKKGNRKVDCLSCGVYSGEDDEYIVAVGWPLCECSEEDGYTAVSGTWNVKYNASASKKLAATDDITSAYSLPAYVKSALQD